MKYHNEDSKMYIEQIKAEIEEQKEQLINNLLDHYNNNINNPSKLNKSLIERTKLNIQLVDTKFYDIIAKENWN